MGKIKEIYVCSSCGTESPKWMGKCPACFNWNTFEKQTQLPISGNFNLSTKLNSMLNLNNTLPIQLSNVDLDIDTRYPTNISEIDRVLGGGLVKGSVVLLGGAPGIGKSTLLLQLSNNISPDLKILYVSGEESISQIKIRANRINMNSKNFYLASSIDMHLIADMISNIAPNVVVIDSIQTMNLATVSSSVGSVTQVRECTNFIMSIAKSQNISVILVGHVNKDGGIAGPKVLEHVVDVVLQFEGDRNLSYRVLRSIKNRYGSTNEIGVFDMKNDGLNEIKNPSQMLLDGRPLSVPGSCVTCIIEGSRAIFIEVQALVSKTAFGTPRRNTSGFDYNRMSIIIAVLEKRAGYFLGNLDIYINVVGGIKLVDPSCDLAIACAILSSLTDKPLFYDFIVLGEIGLSGEIRNVEKLEQRINEAIYLGFYNIALPKCSTEILNKFNNINFIIINNIRDITKLFS